MLPLKPTFLQFIVKFTSVQVLSYHDIGCCDNNSSNMLQSSQFMSMSSNLSCKQLITKEIGALEAQKDTLCKKIDHQHHKMSISANAKEQKQKYIAKLQQTQISMKNAEIKLQKYKLRKIDLQSDKLSQIIQFQHLQLQLQTIKQQLISVFTPKESKLQQLRLKLIQIQSNEALIKFSNTFSIRKAIIGFLKKNHINIVEITGQPLQFEISKRNLIAQFRVFLSDTLRSKKLSDFNKIFSQPLDKYLEVLQQIRQTLSSNKLKDYYTFSRVQQKQDSLLVQWNIKKLDLLNKKLKIQTLQVKLQQTLTKIKKYDTQIKQSANQKKQSEKMIKYYSKIKQNEKAQDVVLPKLKLELQQLSQAITYLTYKRNLKQTNIAFDSPKSKGLVDTLDHSDISKNLTIQNCQSLRSHFMSQSSKNSKISLFKSPKQSVIRDKSMKMLKILSSPHLK